MTAPSKYRWCTEVKDLVKMEDMHPLIALGQAQQLRQIIEARLAHRKACLDHSDEIQVNILKENIHGSRER